MAHLYTGEGVRWNGYFGDEGFDRGRTNGPALTVLQVSKIAGGSKVLVSLANIGKHSGHDAQKGQKSTKFKDVGYTGTVGQVAQ